jgi:hypothetical protein
MRATLSRIRLWTTVAATLLISGLFVTLAAQDSPSLVWDRPVTVKRVAKAKRVSHPRRKTEKVPLLTLEWRVLKRLEDGKGIETNPSTVFHTGDRVRLGVKANQDGYLYIIHHSEGQDGSLIFPDSRINHGENFVKKDLEYILPAFCPTPEFEDPKDCWWRMTPPSSREEFTVIFSRDMITSLPNQISVSGGVIKLETIQDIKSSTGQVIKRTSRPFLRPEEGGGAGRYITWVTNTNTKDNEELIETIVLTHGL